MLLNVEMYEKSASPEKALLSQVILLAVQDGCATPDKKDIKTKGFTYYGNTRMRTNVYTAMRFLFDDRVAGLNEYAAWLDFDPGQFRKKLLELMANDGPNIINHYTSMHRRAFRINKRLYDIMESNQLNVTMEEEDEEELF